MTVFEPEEDFARELDRQDPLSEFRNRFAIPRRPDGNPIIYFCGNSLGLMPKAVRDALSRELEDWERLAVDAHFDAAIPWYRYHESLRDPLARLVGALPDEVVAMNSLTVNLHLLMASFYRPSRDRFKILMDEPAFPSDTYAVQSQLRHHGLSPAEGLVRIRPAGGAHLIEPQDILRALDEHGDQTALVLLGGVNFFTGQAFDIPAITRAAQARGCLVGIDLAHAVGNVPLSLHDWNVDFAVWCSYKYLNGGPGAVGGAFIHQRHATNPSLPRLAGWWGNDPETRFRMHLNADFVPVPSADSWQVSNPPILAMAPVKVSLSIFDEAGGMAALRQKSMKLTGYLQYLIDRMPARQITVITPRQPEQRGCQLSMLAEGDPRALLTRLESEGVKCDFRPPNVIRAAPTPLYNTFHEVWRFARLLAA
ncbi:MAG: kynureninase [Phycisphaerae bacterium]|nr:kynureninase [Phycisphaerae bacterium]MDW8261558.1 kynureninase [Phycisphaerales bacterium]